MLVVQLMLIMNFCISFAVLFCQQIELNMIMQTHKHCFSSFPTNWHHWNYRVCWQHSEATTALPEVPVEILNYLQHQIACAQVMVNTLITYQLIHPPSLSLSQDDAVFSFLTIQLKLSSERTEKSCYTGHFQITLWSVCIWEKTILLV